MNCRLVICEANAMPPQRTDLLTLVRVFVVMMLRIGAFRTSSVGDLSDDHVNACDDSVVEC